VQVVALAVVFSRRKGPLHWRTIAATAFRTALATALMAAVAAAALAMIPAHHRLSYELARVLLPFLLGVGSFLAVYWLWDRKELRLLLAGHEEPAGDDRL